MPSCLMTVYVNVCLYMSDQTRACKLIRAQANTRCVTSSNVSVNFQLVDFDRNIDICEQYYRIAFLAAAAAPANNNNNKVV